MTIRVDCPDCRKTLVLADTLAGRSVRCPACDQVVPVPGRAGPGGITTRPEPPRIAREEPPAPRPRPKKGGSAAFVLGILALVLGGLALATSWIPFICVGSLVVAGVGLIVAAVGVLVALITRGRGLGFCCGGGAVSLVALALAIAMTYYTRGLFTSFQQAILQQALDDDEPEAGATLPGWGQVYDPDGDCTCTLERGGLSIRIPATAHDLSAEIGTVNAPRVLQEVEGDFSARVKVCGVIRPTAAPGVLGRVPFQSGGLLLYHDCNNYVRLERAALRRGGQIQCYASLEQRSGGIPVLPPASTPLPEEDVLLRLERQGNQVFGYVSVAGGGEIALGPLTVDYPPRVRIGVAAVNAAEQPLAVRFEQFTVQKK